MGFFDFVEYVKYEIGQNDIVIEAERRRMEREREERAREQQRKWEEERQEREWRLEQQKQRREEERARKREAKQRELKAAQNRLNEYINSSMAEYLKDISIKSPEHKDTISFEDISFEELLSKSFKHLNTVYTDLSGRLETMSESAVKSAGNKYIDTLIANDVKKQSEGVSQKIKDIDLAISCIEAILSK